MSSHSRKKLDAPSTPKGKKSPSSKSSRKERIVFPENEKRMDVWVYDKPKKKRPNVHAKSKTSKLKSSKNYKKKYNRQGR